MPKDLKIGLAVGLGLVAVAVLWLATRPSLTPQARIQRLHTMDARKETGTQTDTRYSMLDAQAPLSRDTQDSVNENPKVRIDKPELDIPKTETIAQSPAIKTKRPEPSIEHQAPGIQREPTEVIKTERFYIVRKNDTLSSISSKYYGTASQWPKIFDANRQTISDANKLPIGAKLIIPD